jgi:hypothetical protein
MEVIVAVEVYSQNKFVFAIMNVYFYCTVLYCTIK